MEQKHCSLEFSVKQVSSHFGYATITVPEQYVNLLYTQASHAQQSGMHTNGFIKGATPLDYIKQNFQPHLLEHIKEFFFKYFVINWLYQELQSHKLLIAGDPRLTDISVHPNQDALYSFSLTLSQPISLQGWKRLPFRAPKRKNYKDLDKQVKNFLKDEIKASKDYNDSVIALNDWICFSVCILDSEKKELFNEYSEKLWVKIGAEEADSPLQKMFIGKKIKESFITDNKFLQDYFSSHIDAHYNFKITILDVAPHAFFNFNHFKKHFRIRNNQELHLKLIEVFSYRNDMSQRRTTAEDTLKLLLSRHTIDVPNHLILRQQKSILDDIHSNPDYQVYKMQNDFHDKVRLLAVKQVKEIILMHQLACYENITVNDEDIKGYLNLTKRPRTQEFIYFEPPMTKFLGQEAPLSAALIAQCCLREKTLNHAIYYLTKQKAY
ncbi:trigger factor family protein [Candidatus Babeliales bacterium]|nr:trigger factor family protein [Candidatus Babeliales bacterium]